MMKNKYIDKNREGDHICYVSNLSKMEHHYPQWDLTKTLEDSFKKIFVAWQQRRQ